MPFLLITTFLGECMTITFFSLIAILCMAGTTLSNTTETLPTELVATTVETIVKHPLSSTFIEEDEEEMEELPTNRTFAIIKPDAVAHAYTGNIIDLIERNGFTILSMKKFTLNQKQAETFYAVHKERPFFKDLVAYMTSGPVVVLALEKDDAITEWRTLMGATNPAKAQVGTMRKMFGTDITHNATHGSDAPETAAQELAFFFPELS